MPLSPYIVRGKKRLAFSHFSLVIHGLMNVLILYVMQKVKMIMNDTNSWTEIKATIALSDLNRRERLLKIIRGKPAWKYYAVGAIWFVFIAYIFHTEKANNTVLFAFIPLLFTIAGAYVDFSRRINSLIELIGEENLRKPKADDKEQNA